MYLCAKLSVNDSPSLDWLPTISFAPSHLWVGIPADMLNSDAQHILHEAKDCCKYLRIMMTPNDGRKRC